MTGVRQDFQLGVGDGGLHAPGERRRSQNIFAAHQDQSGNVDPGEGRGGIGTGGQGLEGVDDTDRRIVMN